MLFSVLLRCLMVSNRAAYRRAGQAVMMSHVAGYAAHHSAFDATLRLRGDTSARNGECDDDTSRNHSHAG
jgi:hypothetical protein